MITGTLIKSDGTKEKIKAKNGKEFDLTELQNYVGGFIQFVELPDKRTVCLNENGLLEGLPKNEEAQKVWDKAWPKEEYFNSEQLIVGDVLIIDK